jgi:hypothetical protein
MVGAPRAVTDPLAEDLARKQGAAGRDPLADDLARKTRTQAQWEASPQYARLKAKHEKTMADVERMKAEPSPFSPGELWKNRGELGSDFMSGVGTVANDELNAGTFGLYGRAREALLSRLAPEDFKRSQEEDARNRETPGFGLMSGIGQGGAAGLGGAGKVYQGVQSLVGAGKPVITGALAGGATGALQGAVRTVGKEDVTGVLAEAGKEGALGAGLGAGVGAIAKYVGGAPQRKAESELAGLKDGVQYKTRVQKFQPNEDNMRAALAEQPQFRSLAKTDPVSALPEAERIVAERSETLLAPYYRQMAATGQDRMPIATVVNQLKAVKAGFNPIAEKGPVAVVDTMIGDFEAMAAQNGGTVPAQFVRETATSFGKQGFANTPMFGQVALPKQMKQGVSMALRESIGDHVESLAGDTAAGKALRAGYEAANKEVSTWLKIRDIIDEKATRISGNARPMGDLVTEGLHAIRHPWMTVGKLLAGKAPDIIDRRVLGPAVASPVGQALAPVGQAAQVAVPPLATNRLIQLAQESKRRDAEMAARVRAARGMR